MPNDVWASNALTQELTLPSGQTCTAQRIDMTDVIRVGMGDALDNLTSKVMSDHIARVRGPQDHKQKGSTQDVIPDLSDEDIMENPNLIKAGIMMFDKVVPLIVVKPVVKSHFRSTEDGKSTEMIPAGDREQGVIYTDRISLDDKVYLFNWAVGKLPDAGFREESGGVVGPVEHVEVVQHSPVQTTRTGQNRADRRRRRR